MDLRKNARERRFSEAFLTSTAIDVRQNYSVNDVHVLYLRTLLGNHTDSCNICYSAVGVVLFGVKDRLGSRTNLHPTPKNSLRTEYADTTTLKPLDNFGRLVYRVGIIKRTNNHGG